MEKQNGRDFHPARHVPKGSPLWKHACYHVQLLLRSHGIEVRKFLAARALYVFVRIYGVVDHG